MEQKNPVQSAERIFHVFETIAESGPMGLMALSQRLNLHKSTVHRLLTSLSYMGYVEQDEETSKYRLTFKIVELSNKFLTRVDILSIVHPYMEKLANQCQETVHLVQRVGTNVVYIDKVSPLIIRDTSIQMGSQVGLARPMYCSAVGKSILAELPEGEIKDIWDNSVIEKKTEHTILSFEQLLRELEKVREKGYALDNEENEIGVRCIGASIFNHQGQVKYAFSVSAPVSRMADGKIKELREYVLDVKKELSKKLGYKNSK